VSQKKRLPPEEEQLFREEMADAIPLEQSRPEPFRRRLPPHPLPQPAHLLNGGDETVELSESEVHTGEFLEFSRPGVQQRVLQELRRGHIEPTLDLDLHGLTVSYARETFDEFLIECQRRHVRCARIIHGKGYRSENRQPVLKQKINYWLRLREEVLAFCSATRRDGGTGAVYVLLRNPRKNRKR
jgi:DNA-nicking Smr family endonuclease